MTTDSQPPADQRLPSFSDRLNYLWDTRRPPRGTPYTLREVHEGTDRKLSQSYLSLLRRGGAPTPSGAKLQVLADFWKVPVSFFTAEHIPDELAESDITPELRDALRNPMVQELALRAAHMGREEWELVLHMMHHAQGLVGRIKTEGASAPELAPTTDEGRNDPYRDEGTDAPQ